MAKKVSFKTKDGKTVSFTPKGGKGKRAGAGASRAPKKSKKLYGAAAAAAVAAKRAGAGATRVTPGQGAGKSAKRSRAAKKAARTRAHNHAVRSRAAKKAARTRARRHGREVGAGSAASIAGAGRHHHGGMSHAARSRAAKKAARTRKRNAAEELRLKNLRRGKGGKFRSTRARPKQHPPMPTKKQVEAWKRHHNMKARGFGAKENPTPMEVLAASAGGILAMGVWWLGDTYLATNAVTLPTGTANGGNSTQLVTKGKVDNEFAKDAPLWSGPGLGPISYRMMWAGGLVVAPLLGSFIPLPGAVKTVLRVSALGAGLGAGGKLVIDGLAKLTGGTAIGQRMFAAQINAQNRMMESAAAAAQTPPKQLGQTSQVNPLPSVPSANPYAVGAAGVRRGFFGLGGNAGAGRQQLGRGQGTSGCCANCDKGLPCAAEIPPDEGEAAAIDQAGAGRHAAPPAHRPNGQQQRPAHDPYAGMWDNLNAE